MRISIYFTLWFFALQIGFAQRLPNDCMHRDTIKIVAWADSVRVVRGWQDLSDPSLGLTSVGVVDDALNKADGKIISLGEGGEAIFYIKNGITNKKGFDFVVFENGFYSQESPNSAFLEIAEVAVSNDGIHYEKFPISFTGVASTAIGTFDTVDPLWYQQVAGNCPNPFGTGFDLEVLASIPSLDVSDIKFVKIKDIIGNVSDTVFCSKDTHGNCIPDPWPTPFAAGGFDLDALGIIHLRHYDVSSLGVNSFRSSCFPSTIRASEILKTDDAAVQKMYLTHINGSKMLCTRIGSLTYQIPNANPGVYILTVEKTNEVYVQKILLVSD